MPAHARTLIEEPGFTKDCEAYANVERMDAALSYITHLLALDPTIGEQIGDTEVWYMPSRMLVRPPPILFYTFNAKEVILIALRAIQCAKSQRTSAILPSSLNACWPYPSRKSKT